jgi:hypothetical protein
MVAAHADLVASVGPRLHQLVRPENGVSEVRFYPLGDDMNEGRCLRVRLTSKAWAHFELSEKVLGEAPVPLDVRRAGPARAAAVLAELLGPGPRRPGATPPRGCGATHG